MPKKNKTEMDMINKALSNMKVGQTKTVRVGPGRQGVVMVKKGKGGPVGEPKLLPPPRKRRAKVIRAKGY